MFFIVSLLIVAFGQPSLSPWSSLIAAVAGYAIFWNLLLDQIPKKRFWLATAWFSGVQLIQLFWFTSHPYLYIYAVYLILALGVGLQFGFLSLLVTRERLKSIPQLLALAGLWTLLEWMRLFLLAGYSLNPAGLALTSNIYSLQAASLIGLYGLSFWVIFVNLLALRRSYFLWASAALLPFIYGIAQIQLATPAQEHYSALLIQTAFPSEETIAFQSHGERVAYVIDEWRQILKLAKKEHGKKTDLIALPEFVVPYGTYTPVFPHFVVEKAFRDIYGSTDSLPPLEFPLAEKIKDVWFVNNAYWLQALANAFQAEVVSGLEDAEEVAPGDIAYYSAAIHVRPNQNPFIAQRYEKRVLMPMGEYIPFSFCRAFAASYGIQGSFTPGKEAKVIQGKQPLGLCICYEETFGHLMRENSQKGARLLVNLTNDGWYPLSTLPKQHLDHARVRTVENGLPLLRACNTGVTTALDSHGRTIAELDNRKEAAGALHVKVPLSTYPTLYSHVGDTLIVIVSGLCICLFFRKIDLA